MKILLDTHVAFWFYAAPEKISKKAMAAILESEECLFSAASAWEHSIKRQKYGDSYAPPVEFLLAGPSLKGCDFPFECHKDAEELPPIHGDPFDRMLVAHARHLNCPIVTRDAAIRRYPVATIW